MYYERVRTGSGFTCSEICFVCETLVSKSSKSLSDKFFSSQEELAYTPHSARSAMFIAPNEYTLVHSVRSAMSMHHETKCLGYAAAQHGTPNGVRRFVLSWSINMALLRSGFSEQTNAQQWCTPTSCQN